MRGVGRGERAVLAQAALLCFVLAGNASAQTVEPRYDPHATGAATIIYPDDTALGAQNLLELLRWYVPGIQIDDIQDSLKIYLRGAGVGLDNPPPNPLLIINGAKVSPDFFEAEVRSLDTFSIERIEVFRDVASSVMYGTRAAGGVILVFTRRR